MIWMGFLATGLAVREGGHIAVEFVVERMPPGIQRAMLAVVRPSCLAFLAVVVIAEAGSSSCA